MDRVEEFLSDRLRGRKVPEDLRRLVEMQLDGQLKENEGAINGGPESVAADAISRSPGVDPSKTSWLGLASRKTVTTFAGSPEFAFLNISHFLPSLNQLSFLANSHFLSSPPLLSAIRVIGDSRRGHT